MASKNKIYIILGIFITLSLILVVCSVFLFNGIIKKSKELLAGEEKIVVSEREFKDIEAFKKQYGDFEPNLEKIDQLFVDSHNPVGFIEFLEKTALGYGLSINMSIPSFSGATTVTGAFQFYLTGGFPSIFGFIKEIENGPYLIQIKSLSITKNNKLEKDQMEGQLKADFLIQVLAK